MAYASRLLREQSIAKKSFIEVMPRCPLLLCLVGDRSIRRRATAPLLHAVPRAAVAAAESPLLHAGTAPLLVVVPTAAPPSPPLLLWPSAASPQPPSRSVAGRTSVLARAGVRASASPRTAVRVAGPRARSSSLKPLAPSTSSTLSGWSTAATSRRAERSSAALPLSLSPSTCGVVSSSAHINPLHDEKNEGT
ncbi:hypothetical protein Scep_016854 [Stephania cephalantha]|uniref:Uncharacterized protein n=1 Tax=Stephania cephalantha TaxID=152367 RepID=A0AAP0INI7_9MAGN